MNSTADVVTLTPGTPIEIVEFGVIVTTALVDTSGTGFILTCDLRPTAGTDTGRTIGGGNLGTGTFTHAQAILGVAGVVLVSRPLPNTTGVSARIVQPGQQAILRLNAAVATSGVALPFINYRPIPQNVPPQSTEVDVTV